MNLTKLSNEAQCRVLRHIYRRCVLTPEGACTFVEVWDAFHAEWGDTERKARWRLARWRGAQQDKLSPAGGNAWMAKLPLGAHCYVVTDYALRRIGMAREAADRAMTTSLVSQRIQKIMEQGIKKPRLTEQVVAAFKHMFPAGGSANSLFYAASMAGSKVTRKNISIYAAVLIKRGLLQKIARGRYRAIDPEDRQASAARSAPVMETQGVAA